MSDESKKIRPGDVLELEIVDVGGTGVFIARHDGQVVFVRHAAVGEVVRAEVTVVNKNFLRADTVEVIEPSPNRVEPPCSLAGVCGGCDYQHLELSAQREIKSALLRNTLQHVGRIDAIAGRGLGDFAVEPLVDEGGLRWRTRTRFAVTPDGSVGFRMSRSHSVVEVEDCLTSIEGATQLAIKNSSRATRGEIEIVGHNTDDLVVVDKQGGPWVSEQVAGRSWRIHASNFWQAHKNAPGIYVKTVLDFADVSQNDLVLDLYSGSALFAAPLATLANHVVAVESNIDAVRNARRSCSDLANLDLLTATVEDFLANNDEFFDVVVLDPPRAGAGEATISEIAKITKRRIIYVACEPAALARDTAQLASVGWELVDLRAFDAFPMTAHFECIALFKRSSTM